MRDSSYKDFGMAIWDVEDILENSPTGSGESLWNQLVRNCKDEGVDQKFVTPVESCISKYIAGLSGRNKRRVWEETDTGIMNAGNSEDWDIFDIEMDLANELFQAVLDDAFRLARETMQRRTKKSRVRRKSGADGFDLREKNE